MCVRCRFGIRRDAIGGGRIDRHVTIATRSPRLAAGYPTGRANRYLTPESMARCPNERGCMEAIEVLCEEHEGVLTVLNQLERAMSAAERGVPIPADIFGDIQEFFLV